MIDNKICRLCEQIFPASTEFFYEEKRNRSGLTYNCRSCVNKQKNKWRKANKNRVKASYEKAKVEGWARPEKVAKRWRKLAERNPIRTTANNLMQGINTRCKEKGWERPFVFSSREYFEDWLIKQPECECCSKSFYIGPKNGKKHNLSPTIDRFDNNLGYTVENCRLICWRCNNLKRDATIEELEIILRWMKSE